MYIYIYIYYSYSYLNFLYTLHQFYRLIFILEFYLVAKIFSFFNPYPANVENMVSS